MIVIAIENNAARTLLALATVRAKLLNEVCAEDGQLDPVIKLLDEALVNHRDLADEVEQKLLEIDARPPMVEAYWIVEDAPVNEIWSPDHETVRTFFVTRDGTKLSVFSLGDQVHIYGNTPAIGEMSINGKVIDLGANNATVLCEDGLPVLIWLNDLAVGMVSYAAQVDNPTADEKACLSLLTKWQEKDANVRTALSFYARRNFTVMNVAWKAGMTPFRIDLHADEHYWAHDFRPETQELIVRINNGDALAFVPVAEARLFSEIPF